MLEGEGGRSEYADGGEEFAGNEHFGIEVGMGLEAGAGAGIEELEAGTEEKEFDQRENGLVRELREREFAGGMKAIGIPVRHHQHRERKEEGRDKGERGEGGTGEWVELLLMTRR